jgi:predicted nucleotidyltransferase
MNTKEDILRTLRELRQEIRVNYKVKEIGVFGSVIRGEQTEKSDIDVLVDFEEDASFFDLVGLGLFLEEKLNQKVDVVSKRALREEIKDSILAEAITI